jgi:CheY-like chemotaxis protein
MIVDEDIVIIDYDVDDQKLIKQIFDESGYVNKLIFFDDSTEAFEYLSKPDIWPFIIICELSMPKIGGLELRQMILDDPIINLKSIPFIFFTTIKSNDNVVKAYKKCIQGYFRKANSYERYKETVQQIITYWRSCLSPEH